MVPVVPVALRALLVVTVVIARFQTGLRPLQLMAAWAVLDRTGQTLPVVPVVAPTILPTAQSSTVVVPVVQAAVRAERAVRLGLHLPMALKGAPATVRVGLPLPVVVVLEVVRMVTVRTVLPTTTALRLLRIPALVVLVVLRLLAQRLRMAVPVLMVTAFYIGWLK